MWSVVWLQDCGIWMIVEIQSDGPHHVWWIGRRHFGILKSSENNCLEKINENSLGYLLPSVKYWRKGKNSILRNYWIFSVFWRSSSNIFWQRMYWNHRLKEIKSCFDSMSTIQGIETVTFLKSVPEYVGLWFIQI